MSADRRWPFQLVYSMGFNPHAIPDGHPAALELIGYMTQGAFSVELLHQAAHAVSDCIRAQYPWLTGISPPEWLARCETNLHQVCWLDKLERSFEDQFPDGYPLRPMNAEEWNPSAVVISPTGMLGMMLWGELPEDLREQIAKRYLEENQG